MKNALYKVGDQVNAEVVTLTRSDISNNNTELAV